MTLPDYVMVRYGEALKEIWTQFYHELVKVIAENDLLKLSFMLGSKHIGGMINICFCNILKPDTHIEIFKLFLNNPCFDLRNEAVLDSAYKNEYIPYFQVLLERYPSIHTEMPNILFQCVGDNMDLLMFLINTGKFNDQIDEDLYDAVLETFEENALVGFRSHPLVKAVIETPGFDQFREQRWKMVEEALMRVSKTNQRVVY